MNFFGEIFGLFSGEFFYVVGIVDVVEKSYMWYFRIYCCYIVFF